MTVTQITEPDQIVVGENMKVGDRKEDRRRNVFHEVGACEIYECGSTRV